jgi:UDP-N-acetylmuramate--alanine ligase
LRLAVAVAEHHPQVRYVSSLAQLPQVLTSILQAGDLAIFLGAGDLNQQIAATMRAYAAQVGEQLQTPPEGE